LGYASEEKRCQKEEAPMSKETAIHTPEFVGLSDNLSKAPKEDKMPSFVAGENGFVLPGRRMSDLLQALEAAKEFIENLQLDAPEWHEVLDRCCAAIAKAKETQIQGQRC